MSSLNNPFLIKSYSDEDGNFYRIYSDGWCEQGGIATSSEIDTSINFLKPFKDTNYNLLTTSSSTSIPSSDCYLIVTEKLKNGATIRGRPFPINWYAFGYME